MMPPTQCRKILMTVDAVGGVWRYAMDLASALKSLGTETVFLGFGPAPDERKRQEVEQIGKLLWSDAPLDWLVSDRSQLDRVSPAIAQAAADEGVDLVHLNLPSQAANLEISIPVLTVAHSCVVTWFAAVRGHAVPQDWAWQRDINWQGFERSDAVVAPSRGFAALLQQAYGRALDVQVIHNASPLAEQFPPKEEFVFAAARWWDDGKNGTLLDRVANQLAWPLRMAGPASSPNGNRVTLQHAQHLGELDYPSTLALMGNAAIFVSPSLYEPFGLATLEAARMRCALVLADIPVYRELWDGCALFANPHDEQAFSDAILRLICDPILRLELSTKAQAASRRYSSQAQAAAMNALYQQLIPHPFVTAAAE